MLNMLSVNLVLIVYPLLYFAIYKWNEGFDNPNLKNYVNWYLRGIIVFFFIQLILGIYLKFFFSYNESLITILILLFSLLIFLDLKEEYSARFRMMFMILILIASFFIIASIFFKPDLTIPIEQISSTSILITLLIITLAPMFLLLVINRIRKRKEEGLRTKDFKYLTYYFLIAFVFFLIFGLISVNLYSAQIEAPETEAFENVDDLMTIIINDVIFDGFFIVTMIFVLLASVARTLGNPAYRAFGSLVTAFLPMLLWLNYWFEPVPDTIALLFGDFTWFAKVFYIILATMLIIIFLSGFTLITSVAGVG